MTTDPPRPNRVLHPLSLGLAALACASFVLAACGFARATPGPDPTGPTGPVDASTDTVDPTDAAPGEPADALEPSPPEAPSLPVTPTAETVPVPEPSEPEPEPDERGVNFAGSVQLDYLAVPTDVRARAFTFDGFTTELSLKLSADVGEHISVQVKTCYGCHGFEIGAAYVDFRATDDFTIRAGRFTPAFGDFPVRHDPANHLTSDKPLPYDMGRMLHLRDWNMSVLPAPYVDSGLQASWTPSLSESVDAELSAFVIGGLRGSSDATDVDFIQSRSGDFYYVDNNSRPTVGGRLATRMLLGEVLVALGLSAMYGTWDPEDRLDALLLGADLVVRVEEWAFRAEYLVRRTRMALGEEPESTFRYGPGADGQYDPYSLKEGFYGELTFPLGPLEGVMRFDGLRRRGNVPVDSALRSDSLMLRYTLGTNIPLERDWRVKISAEAYDFSDFDDELALHLGVVGAF